MCSCKVSVSLSSDVRKISISWNDQQPKVVWTKSEFYLNLKACFGTKEYELFYANINLYVVWINTRHLKYCRYGVKLHPINQSINQSTLKFGVAQFFLYCTTTSVGKASCQLLTFVSLIYGNISHAPRVHMLNLLNIYLFF